MADALRCVVWRGVVWRGVSRLPDFVQKGLNMFHALALVILRGISAVLQDSACNCNQQLEEPNDAKFRTWLTAYRVEKLPDSWIAGKVEFHMIPLPMVGTAEAAKVIKEREHCYLRTLFNGRAVLAVLLA